MTPTRRSTTVKERPAEVAADGQGAANSDSLADLLDLGSTLGSVREDIKSAPERVRRTIARSVEKAEEMLQKTGKIDPAAVRTKILSADFQSVKDLATQEEADFAAALEALKQVCDGMDLEFQQLLEPTAEEKAIVENAKAAVSGIEAEIVRTRETRNPLKTWFGQRERSLTALDERLTAARENVTTSETKLQQLMRQRLMNAKMDASVKAYMDVSAKTVTIMKNRVSDVGEHVKMLAERQEDALAQKSEAASMLKRLNAALENEEAKLKVAESELETLVNGTPEYATKEKEISDLRIQVEQTRGNRNVVLAKFESKEKFLEQNKLALSTLMTLRDSHKARIARLISDTEERGATYKARLMAMKTMADQKFDETLDGIGQTLDKQTLEYMASVTVAANDALMKQFEAHPEKLKEQAVVINTMAEHLASIRARGAKVQRDLQERYGINPGDSSFFTYEGAAGNSSPTGN